MLAWAIDKNSKSSIAKNVMPLSSIFLNAFDLRRQEYMKGGFDDDALSHWDDIEKSANDVALKMVYKLNDAAFRPIFANLMEWTSSQLPRQDVLGRALRHQAVYGFLQVFFDNLKSIVTSYATYLIDDSVSALASTDMEQKEERESWKKVLQALAKCFEHDQDEFWQAPSHFSAVAPTLVAQLLHAPHVDVTPELVPAIVELAAAADSQEHQKELNSAILKNLRSTQVPVRLAAIMCEQALTDKLGEEWLSMLPEMLPYISELQDDDDEVVERETHRWIIKIEQVLGESLDSMLQ
jgi:U3 small nucleolar RNA-associated protein 10